MADMRDWKDMKLMFTRLLVERTGEDVDVWNGRIQKLGLADEKSLRAWLTQQGVTGYAQSMLVMEQFGYPDFFLSSAEELIDRQYAAQPHLRPIFDAIIAAAAGLGDVTIQARKTYVSLVTPRRTFARVHPSRKNRVDIGLLLDGQKPGGRLEPSKIHASMQVQISLSTIDDLDSVALDWLQRAYDQNC